MAKPPYYRARRPLKFYDPAQVFADHVEQFHARNDTWALGCCPFHDERRPSFSMNLESGWFRCNSTHCQTDGKNIVEFIMELHTLTFRQALSYLEARYG